MSRNNYNNEYDNPYNGFEDYGNQEEFYQNTGGNNYTVPVAQGNNVMYEQSNWSLLNQTSYGGTNMAEFLADEYNYYDNNAYMFDGSCNNEYSNNDYFDNFYGNNINSNNINLNNVKDNNINIVQGNGFNNINNNSQDIYKKGKDISLSVISDKLNANVDQELLYDNIGNVNPFTKDRRNKRNFDNDRYGNNDYEDNYDDDYDDNYDDYDDYDDYDESDENDYGTERFQSDRYERRNNSYNKSSYEDNRTVAMDLKNYKGHDRFDTVNDEESVYGRIATDSEYYTRDGVYDAKLLPTQDIVFDDIYVVRNQLFDEEEKMFSFSDVISLGICVAFAVIMAFLIVRYVAQATVVKGHSMEYNFHDKEVVILDKLSYRIGDPKRFDVVVFPVNEGGEQEYYIKRIIGLPGEKVYIDVNKSDIYIDGKKLITDVYGWEAMLSSRAVQHNDVVLGADEYYCMGDNRNNSQDSRALVVGSIKKDDFLGKAIFKIQPFSSFGLIDHYYNHEIRSGNKPAYDYMATDGNQ